jgi:hypothetical protein
MCYGCYEEAGKPTIVTDAIRQCAALIKRLYAMPSGCAGGNCHIVTDDWNLEDHSIKFCSGQVDAGGWVDRTDPEQLKIERQILDLMAPMSEAERASALGLEAGYFTL